MTELTVLYWGPLVSRPEARSLNKKRYFTGKPCRHGHVCERQVTGSACVECVADRRRRNPELNYARVKAWRAEHPEARAEEARRYRAKYPEKVAATSKRWRLRHLEVRRPIEAEAARKRRKNDPEGNRRRLRAYKVKQEQKMAEIAGRPRAFICEVCDEKGQTVFDHCHKSGMFRGWICDRCNKTLGMVKDSSDLLRQLAAYLDENNVEVDDGRAQCAPNEGICWAGPVLSDRH